MEYSSLLRELAVLPATWQRWHYHLYPGQLKLVLKIATREGCKA